MPVVQFSIPAKPWERLERAVEQGESTNQAAKRLLTQLLLGDDSPAPDPEEMDYLNHRLDRLEEIIQLGNAAGPDRLDKLEKRLEKLESELKSLALQFAVDLSPLESRLSEIERRLDSIPAAAVPTPTRLPKATRRGA